MRSLPGPVFFPIRLLAIAYIDLFRGVPTILVIFLLGFGVPALQLPGVPKSPFFWAIGLARPRVLGVRRRGLPGRHRVGAPEPGGGGALARALALAVPAVRDPPAGGPARDPAAAERLHRSAEGHGARRDRSASSRRSGRRRSTGRRPSTSRRTWPRRCCSSLITIPLARFTDWLIARDRAAAAGRRAMA